MLDAQVFEPVPTQLSTNDMASLLAVQAALAKRLGTYAYLEVGSYLGGSLQPYLADPRCIAVYSVDPRPPRQPDERGEQFEYPDNTTERMLETLRPHYGDALAKLRTFDSDVRDLRGTLQPAPSLCFIDGEHTDAAVLSDFQSCLRLAVRPCVILFDDANIVYRGIGKCLAELRHANVAHRAYILPDKIGVIELGGLALYSAAPISELLATADAYLFATRSLDRYRQMIMRIKDVPGVRLLRRASDILARRQRAMGGSRAARPR